MHCIFADSLNRSETETYVSSIIHGEFHATLVDVRTEGVDAHRLAFVHEFADVGYVGKASTHDGSHVLCRIVGLEVCSLVCHPRIARCVALVEGVGSELLPVCPYLLQFLQVVAVALSAFVELRTEFIQFCLELLTHCLTQSVALASGEVGKQTREEHDLLLIYSDAIGVLEVLLHNRNVVLNRLASLLTVNEVWDVVHRARTVERVHGYEVLESRRLEFAQVFLHAGRFELECADGSSVAVELVCCRVGDADTVYIDNYTETFLYVLHRLFHDREGFQSEEVHLDESCLLDDVSVILRTA